MRAAAVAVDGVSEWQHRGVGHLVQRGLAENFVKRDALELRRPHGADEADALKAGQGAVIDADALPIPPHILNSNLCSMDCQAFGTTIDLRLAGSESLSSASATWSRS